MLFNQYDLVQKDQYLLIQNYLYDFYDNLHINYINKDLSHEHIK